MVNYYERVILPLADSHIGERFRNIGKPSMIEFDGIKLFFGKSNPLPYAYMVSENAVKVLTVVFGDDDLHRLIQDEPHDKVVFIENLNKS